VPDLPDAVEKVVLTALAKDPLQRFGTVQAFAMALEQASHLTPIEPTVPAFPPLSFKQARSDVSSAHSVPAVPSIRHMGGTSLVPNSAFPSTQPAPMLHAPNLAFPPLQAANSAQTYYPCPLCSETDLIQKVSGLAASSTSDLSAWLSFPEYTHTRSTQRPRQRASFANIRDTSFFLFWIGFIVFTFLMILAVLVHPFGRDFYLSISLTLIVSVSGLMVGILTKKREKRLKQDFESMRLRQERAYAFWDRLYYCSRDDIVFVPGESTWQVKPSALRKRIFQKYYLK
jgi:hypothetical protein